MDENMDVPAPQERCNPSSSTMETARPPPPTSILAMLDVAGNDRIITIDSPTLHEEMFVLEVEELEDIVMSPIITTTTSTTNINALNDDCLRRCLLHYLSPQTLLCARQVCTRWCAIIDEYLSRKETIRLFYGTCEEYYYDSIFPNPSKSPSLSMSAGSLQHEKSADEIDDEVIVVGDGVGSSSRPSNIDVNIDVLLDYWELFPDILLDQNDASHLVCGGPGGDDDDETLSNPIDCTTVRKEAYCSVLRSFAASFAGNSEHTIGTLFPKMKHLILFQRCISLSSLFLSPPPPPSPSSSPSSSPPSPSPPSSSLQLLPTFQLPPSLRTVTVLIESKDDLCTLFHVLGNRNQNYLNHPTISELNLLFNSSSTTTSSSSSSSSSSLTSDTMQMLLINNERIRSVLSNLQSFTLLHYHHSIIPILSSLSYVNIRRLRLEHCYLLLQQLEDLKTAQLATTSCSIFHKITHLTIGWFIIGPGSATGIAGGLQSLLDGVTGGVGGGNGGGGLVGFGGGGGRRRNFFNITIDIDEGDGGNGGGRGRNNVGDIEDLIINHVNEAQVLQFHRQNERENFHTLADDYEAMTNFWIRSCFNVQYLYLKYTHLHSCIFHKLGMLIKLVELHMTLDLDTFIDYFQHDCEPYFFNKLFPLRLPNLSLVHIEVNIGDNRNSVAHDEELMRRLIRLMFDSPSLYRYDENFGGVRNIFMAAAAAAGNNNNNNGPGGVQEPEPEPPLPVSPSGVPIRRIKYEIKFHRHITPRDSILLFSEKLTLNSVETKV